MNSNCGITKYITAFATGSRQPTSEMKNVIIKTDVGKNYKNWGNWVIGIMQNN